MKKRVCLLKRYTGKGGRSLLVIDLVQFYCNFRVKFVGQFCLSVSEGLVRAYKILASRA